jgi:hypothetical protein
VKFFKGQIPWNKDLKGIHLSPETEFKKGYNGWLGRKHKPESILKISLKKKGFHGSPETEFKKGLVPWNKGKKFPYSPKPALRGRKHTEEWKRKISENHLGEKHWNWKGGVGKNKEYKYAYNKKWVKENKDRLYFLHLRRNSQKKGAGGSHTFKEWLEIKRMFNFTCPACFKKEPEIKLTQDHIIPISKGGSDFIENIQPLCKKCNSRKHTKIIKYVNK